MNLEVKRFEFGDNFTIGRLYIDGRYYCYTIEDVVRVGPKVKHETAIPEGTYKVILDDSPRFGKNWPHILDVPGFTDIRIHQGNTDKDTSGCILLGNTWYGGDFIGNSKTTFNAFLELLRKAGSCSITIS